MRCAIHVVNGCGDVAFIVRHAVAVFLRLWFGKSTYFRPQYPLPAQAGMPSAEQQESHAELLGIGFPIPNRLSCRLTLAPLHFGHWTLEMSVDGSSSSKPCWHSLHRNS